MTYREQSTENKVTEASEKKAAPATSSSTTVYTRPGVSLHPWEYEQIRMTYSELLGDLNMYKAMDIQRAIDGGVELSAILDALEQTAMASRPTHYYFRAILRRYVEQHITTAEEAEAQRIERRKDRKAAKSAQWLGWYNAQAPVDFEDLPI